MRDSGTWRPYEYDMLKNMHRAKVRDVEKDIMNTQVSRIGGTHKLLCRR